MKNIKLISSALTQSVNSDSELLDKNLKVICIDMIKGFNYLNTNFKGTVLSYDYIYSHLTPNIFL